MLTVIGHFLPGGWTAGSLPFLPLEVEDTERNLLSRFLQKLRILSYFLSCPASLPRCPLP